ncbi:MAG: putative sulfate exporter family transporter [Thermodesulfovibrionales bacterium]
MDQERKIDEDKLAEGQCDSPQSCALEKKKGISEDWLALWLGLFIFVLSLGVFGGADILGWGISTKEWTDSSKATQAVSKKFQTVKGEITKVDNQKVTLKKADGKEETITVKEDTSALKAGDKYEKKGISGPISLLMTYLFMLVVMTVGAKFLNANVGKFAVGFTIIFWLSYLCWFLGHFAYIAATKDKLEAFKIPWSLSLTGESGFIIALIAGLIIGNFFPGFAEKLKEASRPELYIKTAIVIMGALLGLKAAQSFSLASNIMFRGLCAIVEAYLIYWAVVYYVARKYFKFSREWAAPLASGISICGVSAAIATGGAIRARPVVPIMVSSLVVIFAVVEMVILPFVAQFYLWSEPLVAGAWMGLAVKTDGGAVASGAMTDALIRAKALEMEGINYESGWITMTATTVKLFIDIFIGIWAFILAVLWCTKIECKPGQKAQPIEIWHRFPKFVIGYVLTFIILLVVCWPASRALGPVDQEIKGLKKEITTSEKLLAAADPKAPASAELNDKIKGIKEKIKGLNDRVKGERTTMEAASTATAESNVFRVMFFVFTFFSIGIVSNFKKLWEEGIGKLAAVYVLCLFGFIIWVGLFISWLFFHGVKPPIAG